MFCRQRTVIGGTVQFSIKNIIGSSEVSMHTICYQMPHCDWVCKPRQLHWIPHIHSGKRLCASRALVSVFPSGDKNGSGGCFQIPIFQFKHCNTFWEIILNTLKGPRNDQLRLEMCFLHKISLFLKLPVSTSWKSKKTSIIHNFLMETMVKLYKWGNGFLALVN